MDMAGSFFDEFNMKLKERYKKQLKDLQVEYPESLKLKSGDNIEL